MGCPRVVLEIWNGTIDTAYGSISCELLIIEHDETAETVLPDGEAGYSTTLVVEGNDASRVDAAFEKYK